MLSVLISNSPSFFSLWNREYRCVPHDRADVSFAVVDVLGSNNQGIIDYDTALPLSKIFGSEG